jgi:membrane protein involved in colicin uptake
MANISAWEKFRKAVGLGYSETLKAELAWEKAELDAQRKASRERILAQQAAAKAAEEAFAKKKAEEAAAKKIAEVKEAARLQNATKPEAPAKKATPKKAAAPKAAPKKKSGGKGTSSAQ